MTRVWEEDGGGEGRGSTGAFPSSVFILEPLLTVHVVFAFMAVDTRLSCIGTRCVLFACLVLQDL